MSGAIDSKYHILIDSKGYILDRGGKAVYSYQKKRAPSWVSKVGSGDTSYRDATFWQYWAQINWRNGAKQEKWGDGGKFWKSENVDCTQMEQIVLSKSLVSAGQVEAGATITCMAPWRSSQNWWDTNYGYRQQLSIVAPAGKTIPVNYPISINIDTAALQTANKVRSDRKDWRVVYWNGTSWVDLARDYVTTTKTVFSTQATISPGVTDSNYYVYYGYAAESTDKQPTDDTTWNNVYGMYGATPDSNSLAVYHFKEGSGASAVDTKGAYDMSGNPSWSTDGPFGRSAGFTSNAHVEVNSNDLSLGSVTLEAWIKINSLSGYSIIIGRNGGDAASRQWNLGLSNGKFEMQADGCPTSVTNATYSTGIWYHVAGTNSGTGDARVYVNGVLASTPGGSGVVGGSSGAPVSIGAKYDGTDGNSNFSIAHSRISNVARTSFPYAEIGSLTAINGNETTTQPPASSFTLYVGTDTGRVYTWDGATTFTLAKDFNILVDDGLTTNADKRVGDTAGTEYKQAQSIQVAKGVNVKSLKLRMKATATAPTGDVTVRIETDSTNAPSGTLADASAITTIPNFTGTSYADVIATFANSFALTAATKYWIVISCAAQANDVGWDVSGNTTSIYADGSQSQHNGSTWTNNATHDLNFVLYTNQTSVNCAYVTSTGGQKLLFGTGKIDSQVNGDALLWGYDGSTWSIVYAFKTATESQVTAMTDFSSKFYVGVGPQARVYESSDLSTFTLSKDIDFPQKPGYIYSLKEYNSQLIAAGGSPEFLPTKNYGGFAFVYNGTLWQSLYPFDHTIIKSTEFYDAFLFMGTYHGQIYTYNTSYLDPLFSWKDDYDYAEQVKCMKYFDDKLFVGLYPQDNTSDTNGQLWVFERHGLSLIGKITGIKGITSLEQVNNILMIGTGSDGYVYKMDPTQYCTTGYLQTSYFDANLPSINKLWDRIELNHEPLLGGQSITLDYRYKEDDAWINIPASPVQVVGGTTTTFPFPTATSSKKITIRITLNTTDQSKSPTLKEFILRYTIIPVTKFQWNLRIKAKSPLKLADGTLDTRTGEEIRADLESALSDTTLHSFTDIDGVVYSVLFYDLDEGSWVINQEDSSGATVPITLIQA